MTKTEILTNYNLNLDDSDSNNFEGLYNLFLDYEIASADVLETVTCINGCSIETLLDVLYVKCGLRSIEQLLTELSE